MKYTNKNLLIHSNWSINITVDLFYNKLMGQLVSNKIIKSTILQ